MKCTKCEIDKPEDDFSWKVIGTKRATHCKSCHSKYRKSHYKANHQKYIDKAKKKRTSHKIVVRQFLLEYKEQHPCVRCSEKDPVVLDFDHLGNKEINLAEAASSGWSLERIKKEIAKCQILCANCHRRKTAEHAKTSQQKV